MRYRRACSAAPHADETPVQTVVPGQGKTQRTNVRAYATTQFAAIRAAVHDFADSRAGEHARTFRGQWRGKPVCDDDSAYKAGFEPGITEIGCMAHARRKFFELHINRKRRIAEQALRTFGMLYDVGRDIMEPKPEHRREVRQERARPTADALHEWLLARRGRVSEGSAIAKALDYRRKRREALTRHLNDGYVPLDNNWWENQIRPWATGRANRLFAGSLRAGKRAAAIMRLIRSAQLNDPDPSVCLKDVLNRLPSHRADDIAALPPHCWAPVAA